MITNPTPLTAEERFRLAKIWDMSDASMSQLNAEDDISFLLCLVRKMELAAQQNAELVAENERLNSDIAGLKAQLKDAEINFKALADGTIRDEAIGMLRAENERLKQQLASNFERRPIMTNDQQAYDRAMAHNAMLREALGKYEEVYPYVCDLKDNAFMAEHHEGLTQVINLWLRYGRVALNATEADAEAWEKKLRQDVMLAVHPLQPEYEKLQQQLATVTAERDALRKKLSKYG